MNIGLLKHILEIPRYIITLHELLAHTPPDHVEKKSLENAREKLEDLSRQMHDEVSETENIRKNLAIERMIIEGCDILLDVNQVFVRQGTLIQVCTVCIVLSRDSNWHRTFSRNCRSNNSLKVIIFYDEKYYLSNFTLDYAR